MSKSRTSRARAARPAISDTQKKKYVGGRDPIEISGALDLRAIVMDHPMPSPEDTEDFLLSCRYGDLDDVKSFIDRFGTAPVGESRDENGNNVLHMASANGHIGKSIHELSPRQV